MRTPHDSFPQPSEKNVKLWRYMDLAKFLSFLQERKLYFARADTLGDPFEGSVPRANHQHTQLLRELRRHPELKDHAPDLKFYFEMSDEQFDQMNATMSRHTRQSVQEFFVSCWHMSEFESAAMWNQYGPKNSLCVQSTYARLETSLPDFINLGMIKYIDYNREIIFQGNGFNNIMHKRKSFEHEREVRAVHWTMLSQELYDTSLIAKAGESGIKIGIDLENLVERIFISPEAPSWLQPLVEDILAKYSLNRSVTSSELGEAPLY